LAAAEPNLSVLRLAPVISRIQLMEEILDGMASETDTSLSKLGYRDTTGGFINSPAAGFAAVAAQLSAQVDRTFVVCLDELDSMLVNCRDDQSAAEILDFIMYINETSLPIRFVFTLSQATPQIMRTDVTSFIAAARIADLTPWTEWEARNFVEGLLSPRLAVDDSAYGVLFAEGGGHPYLTKAILQQIVNAADARVTNDVISANEVRAGVAAALVAPELHHTLDNIVNMHFSSDEVLVLRQLAEASDPLAIDDFASRMSAFNDLHRRHYVRPAGDGFVLAFGLLGRWLLGRQ
jgi:hypothetical protein